MPKLTKTLIESQKPGEKDIVLRDTEIKGFMCKITPRGKRTYLLYYRTAAGKERRPAIGVHGKITCDQARAQAKRWLAEVMEGGDPSGSRQELREGVTVADLWQIYLKDKRGHLKASSIKELSRLWDKYLLPEIGTTPAIQLEKIALKRFHEKNIHRPYTANRMLEAVRSIYNYAITEDLLPIQKNPCTGIKKYPEKKRERYLSMQEIQSLSTVLRESEIARLESPSVIATIRLLLLTGCRLSEILTLKWSYVDFDKRCLNLPESKTGAKVIYLANPALEVLRSIDAVEGNPFVITGGAADGKLAPPQKAWRRIRAKAGIDDVRLHDLRHSFASVGAAGGLSLPMIGALLGHSQTQTTERYSHLASDPLLDAANLIGDRIAAAMSETQAEVIDINRGNKQ